MKLGSDLFLLEGSSEPILFAPLKDLTARINQPAAQALINQFEGKSLTADEAALIKQLESYRFFEDAPQPEFAMMDAPVAVTLFPSDGCNLRCVYCYASAAICSHLMSFDVAKRAIDHVSQNALEAGFEDFSVGFHGNGEPFTNFPLLKEASLYAIKRGEELGIEAKLTAATNAILTDEMIDFIIEHFDGVNVSFDGLPEVQNSQRPLADGSPSFPLVDRTLKRIDTAGMHYAIRATVTQESVGRMEDMARFIAHEYPHCVKFHIEPAWITGRCLETSTETAQAEEFIQHFKAMYEILDAYGVEASYSSVKHRELTNRFCAVCDSSFTVTEKGLVTSCFEVANEQDPRAYRYIFGAIDDNGLTIYPGKRAWLSRLTVENMPHCHDCFCQYSCAGDCPAKVLGANDPEQHAGSNRCTITKALTLFLIERMLDKAEETMSQQEEEVADGV